MPPKKVYATFGSTTITVPEKMVGYDKNHHLHLWNTITPKTHRLSYHNHKTAINLQVNPNTNRKIQRVPRTTKYMSYEKKNIVPNGGGANGQVFRSPVQVAQQPPPPPPPAPPQPRPQLTIVPPAQPVVEPTQVVIPRNQLTRADAASRIQSVFRKKQLEIKKEEEQLDNAFTTLEKTLLRRNIQRKYNERLTKKKEQQEKYTAFKILSAKIKRKEAQRDYISYIQNEQQLLRDKLNDVYKEVGKLLQKIKLENEKQYEGNIPDKIKYKRYMLDMNLNDYLNQALQILDILKSKYNENIEVHLYNIDRFKTEIDDRKHYTREELDAMSMDYIKRLLKYTADESAIIASTREDIQQYRDVYNAYQRKYRRSIASS